jgi:hypothetical protein
MSTRRLVLSDHEAFLALPFVSRFGPDRAGVPELLRKLQDVIRDKGKLSVELNEDDLGLLTEGYEDQAATFRVTGMIVGKGPVKDKKPWFNPEQTELYRRMKRALAEQGNGDRGPLGNATLH